MVLSIRGGRAIIGVKRPSANLHIESFGDPDLFDFADDFPAVVARARVRWEEEPMHPAYVKLARPSRQRNRRQQGTAQTATTEGEGAAEQQQPETLLLFQTPDLAYLLTPGTSSISRWQPTRAATCLSRGFLWIGVWVFCVGVSPWRDIPRTSTRHRAASPKPSAHSIEHGLLNPVEEGHRYKADGLSGGSWMLGFLVPLKMALSPLDLILLLAGTSIAAPGCNGMKRW